MVHQSRRRPGLPDSITCRSWLAAAGIACALLGALSARGRASVVVQDAASDPDARVFTANCGKCHPIERVIAMRRTRSQWEEVISTMISARNAQVSDEDFDTILGYLARTYGRVNVNRAPADDLVEVLHISDTVAAAIVSYRKEHGAFADFDALVKVPGIDREQLEKQRDALLF